MTNSAMIYFIVYIAT